VSAIGTPAAAQTPPDAGALRQQIERQPLAPPLPESGSPLQSDASAPIRLQDGASLTVKSFRFAGNTLLRDEQLQPRVNAWLNRPVGFADLQRAALAVATTYRDAGWIVFAYLPQQDVTDGVVTIQINESRFAGAQLEGVAATRLNSETALRYVQQEAGQPLSGAALDRSLLLINDLPGVSVSGALSPGDRQGETELLLRLTDDRLIDGIVRVDNGGARSTGEQRALLTTHLNSPLRIGDHVRADLLHSKGSDYLRLAYGMPVGSNGLQIGASGSYFKYDLVGKDFAALNGAGDSSSFGVDANYPLLRSRLRNLYLTFAADERKFSNEALGVRQSDYAITSFTTGIAGNVYDRIWGGGASSFTLSWSKGRLHQGTLQIGENPELDRNFDKILYGVSRQQVLTSTLSLYGAINGQYSDDVLDSADRYYLGGPDGVRAYPINDGGGSRSVLASVELRWLIHPALSAAIFDDWGHVGNRSNEADYTLRGYGLSVTWRAPLGIQVEASYALRDGSNPNPAANGAYQDGSRHRNRWWLHASMPF
jgi:hemolysin activation/secretion protein